MNALTKESLKTANRAASEASMQVDPDVKMPAAVRAATKLADDMVAAMNAKQGEAAEAPAEAPVAAAEAPVAQTEAPQNVAPVELQEPVTLQGNTQETQPATPADADDWKHKYQSLHGRFTKQETSLRSLQDEIGNLHNVIATLQASGRVQASELAEPVELSSLVTDEEVNEYGKDLLDVVGRRAQEAMAPLWNAAQQEIAQLKAQLAGVNGFVAQDSKDKLHVSLDGNLPQWREMNRDPAFLDWLALPDPFSGAIRHDMLKEAYAQGHASRVLAFFKGYLAQEAAVAPAGGPDMGTAQSSAQNVPKVPLASLAAPGRAKAAATDTVPAGNEKPIISRAQIAAFYAEVAAGKYKNRPDDKAKTEAVIFSATRDGRVR